jgi:transposase
MITDSSYSSDEFKKLKNAFAEKERFYQSEIKILKEQIRFLQDKLFGVKTEKITESGQQQLHFFNNEKEPRLPQETDYTKVPSHKRKKPGRKPLPASLPRVERIHDLSEEEKICKCGCQKTCFDKEISEQLDYVPAKVQVIRNIRLKYVCKNCEGVEADEPAVSIAPLPLQIIPKSIATPGLLAHIFTSKFVDSLPFYRQEKQFLRLGVQISRANMCNWAMKVAEKSFPLLELLQKELLSGLLINVDETTLKVLKEPNKSKKSKCYMWVFRGGPIKSPVLIYHYHPSRSGDVAAAMLRDYKGYVQTDGYIGYDFLDKMKDIIHLACWAHARRKFVDVIKVAGKRGKGKKKANAQVALDYIRDLYKIEKEARKNNLTFEQIQKERQLKSKPILENFKVWLEQKSVQTPPKGVLGKAIT